VVLFVDDLQWAGRTPLGFVDLVLGEEQIDGLLLVAAYRDSEVDAAHPLAAPLSRWRDEADVRHLHLDNLPVSGSVAMVAEMLRVDPAAAVPAHLGQSQVAGMVAARVEAMPPASRQLVEAMACLGGRAELSLLATATGAPAGAVEQSLAPALDEGMLVMEPGAHQAVRFRLDRIREVIQGGLDPRHRRGLQLSMARRLAAVPESFAVAAEQYLPVIDTVQDAAERRQVVVLLRRAAEQAAMTGNHSLVSALLTAALRLIDPAETATLVEAHTGRHAALYGMGRLEEADEEYRTIARQCTTALGRVDATVVQVRSLTQRNRFAEAIGLGIESLRELGITVPSADRVAAELDHQFVHLYRWLDLTDAADDLVRPDITEPGLIAATRMINVVLPPTSFVADHATNAWLSLEALRIWLEHGPGRPGQGGADRGHRSGVEVTRPTPERSLAVNIRQNASPRRPRR
jgi:predicted ATPase